MLDNEIDQNIILDTSELLHAQFEVGKGPTEKYFHYTLDKNDILYWSYNSLETNRKICLPNCLLSVVHRKVPNLLYNKCLGLEVIIDFLNTNFIFKGIHKYMNYLIKNYF